MNLQSYQTLKQAIFLYVFIMVGWLVGCVLRPIDSEAI